VLSLPLKKVIIMTEDTKDTGVMVISEAKEQFPEDITKEKAKTGPPAAGRVDSLGRKREPRA